MFGSSTSAGTATTSAIRDLFVDPEVGGTTVELTSGTVVFEQDTPADHLYFIERGQVRVYQDGPDGSGRLVEILGPGQWFGCAALVPGGRYGTRAVAVQSVQVVRATGQRLLEVLRTRPGQAVDLIQTLASAVQVAREDAARLVFDDCNSRLVQALVRFSRSAAATPGHDGVVLRITHEQLAQAVGVARETVSLALTEMRHQNLVRTGRNQLQFNPDALKQFATSRRTNGTNGTNGTATNGHATNGHTIGHAVEQVS